MTGSSSPHPTAHRSIPIFPGGSGGGDCTRRCDVGGCGRPGYTPGIGKKPVRSDPGGQGNRPPCAPSSIRASDSSVRIAPARVVASRNLRNTARRQDVSGGIGCLSRIPWRANWSWECGWDRRSHSRSGIGVTESGITAWRQGPATRPLEGPSWIVGVSITDSSRASTPYSGTLNHPAPHVPAQAPLVGLRL